MVIDREVAVDEIMDALAPWEPWAVNTRDGCGTIIRAARGLDTAELCVDDAGIMVTCGGHHKAFKRWQAAARLVQGYLA